jgi:hypothetical protein
MHSTPTPPESKPSESRLPAPEPAAPTARQLAQQKREDQRLDRQARAKFESEIQKLPVNDSIKGMLRYAAAPATQAQIRERERKAEERRAKIASAEAVIAERAKPYPLYVCDWCLNIVGWRANYTAIINGGHPKDDSQLLCLDCVSKGVWGTLDDPDVLSPIYLRVIEQGGRFLDRKLERRIDAELAALSDPPLPLASSLLRCLGGRRRYEQARLRNWRRFVDGQWESEPPMDAPGDRFFVWGAERTEIDAPDKSGRLVLFKAGSYRWDGRRFLRQRRPWRSQPKTVTPTVWPATLPLEQLVEAWEEFRVEVAQASQREWARSEQGRERDRESRALRQERERQQSETLLGQRGIAELLDDGR